MCNCNTTLGILWNTGGFPTEIGEPSTAIMAGVLFWQRSAFKYALYTMLKVIEVLLKHEKGGSAGPFPSTASSEAVDGKEPEGSADMTSKL